MIKKSFKPDMFLNLIKLRNIDFLQMALNKNETQSLF